MFIQFIFPLSLSFIVYKVQVNGYCIFYTHNSFSYAFEYVFYKLNCSGLKIRIYNNPTNMYKDT